MFDFLKAPRRKTLRETPLGEDRWKIVLDRVPLVRKLGPEKRERLGGLMQIFLDEKTFEGGREKVAARTREGLGFEKAFSDASQLLLTHLKGKAEARDLLQDLLANMHGAPQGGSKPSDGRPAT